MIDAHAHLTDARFATDLDEVLDHAVAARVERVLACGEDIASSERAFVAATYERVAAVRDVTVGGLVDRVRENAVTLFGGRW